MTPFVSNLSTSGSWCLLVLNQGWQEGGLLGEEQNRHITAMITPLYCWSPYPNLIPGLVLYYYLIMILLIII